MFETRGWRGLFPEPICALEDTLNYRNKAILLVAMVCLTITAFAQTHKTSPAGTQTFTPVEPDAPAVIDQEITSTMQVSHPDATGFIYRLDQLLWAPYVAPKEIEVEGGHEVMHQPSRKNGPNLPDGAMQTFSGPLVGASPILSVDGLGANITGPAGTFVVNSVPPDTNLAVGTTQVVETVNSGFAVFNKTTGAMIAGPYNLTALWSVLPANSPCTGVDGSDGISISDPVVVHDQLAQRWLITVLALPYNASSGAYLPPFYHCVAISATDDATGSWSVFEYNPGSYFSGGTNDLPDYPKMGVWRDSYTFTYDMFNSTGSSYVAAEICGMDRNAMLNGTTVTIICFEKTSTDYALLPPNIDGATYPNLQTSGTAGTDTCSAASPCQPKSTFFELADVSGSSTTLDYYRVHFNFVTTSHSAVDTRGTVTVSSYNTTTCSTGNGGTSKCVPQPTHTGSLPSGETFASESKLDTLADHAMWRAAYRNFGSYESVLFDSSVQGSISNNSAAPRWYELRGINTSTGTGTPTVFQQSTFNPDSSATFRWMGSIAADHNNNMLLGYSASSSSVFPSLYITGRLVGDSVNTMETETQAYLGQNSQVNITEGGSSYAYGYRWGDYSSMEIDPDDCTFWYANLYMKQAGLFNWNTRMLSYAFPSANCSDAASITLPIPLAQGGSTLTSGTATFYWTTGSGGPTGYTLSVGSTQGGSNYFSQSYAAGTYTATVSSLPIDGSTFWVRLTTTGGTGAGFQDYQYTAATLIQPQTITFPNPGTQTYGVSPITLTATASSGLTVSYTVTSGPASVSGNVLTITGAGSVTVEATQAGNSQYSAATPVSDTFAVNQAVLTVSGNNAAMNYGDAGFPAFSDNITGYVNGDGPGVVSGSAAFSTNATLSSTPGSYTLYVTQGTLAAANYSFTFVNAFLNIGQATSNTTVGASPATIGTGDNTTLTATVTGSPNGVAPTGTVTFYNGNTQLGTANLGGNTPEQARDRRRIVTPEILARGKKGKDNGKNGPEYPGLANTATLQVSGQTLGLGASTITASYGGDTNYNGGSSSGSTVTVEQPGLYNPAPGSTLTGTSANFQWYGAPGATAYWIDIGNVAGGNQYYQSGSLPITTESVAVNSLPTNGSTVYVTLYYLINGSWVSNPYTLTAFGGSATLGQITSPAPNSTLTGSSVTFTWSAGSGATAYWLDAGNVAGGNQYYQSGNLGNQFTTTVTTLPTDGSTVYVTLYSLVNNVWLSNAYTYTAYSLASAAGVITSPTPGTTLTGSSATFVWTAGSGASNYWLDIGSTPGGNQYLQSGTLGNVLTDTVSGLPTDGSAIYVTLYSLVGTQWIGNSYNYTAFNATGGLAVMQTPVPGTFISGNSATFTWSLDANATAYWVDISAVGPGGNDVFQSGNLGNVATVTVNSLPGNGSSTLYVTLYSYVGGQWLSNAYTYTN